MAVTYSIHPLHAFDEIVRVERAVEKMWFLGRNESNIRPKKC